MVLKDVEKGRKKDEFSSRRVFRGHYRHCHHIQHPAYSFFGSRPALDYGKHGETRTGFLPELAFYGQHEIVAVIGLQGFELFHGAEFERRYPPPVLHFVLERLVEEHVSCQDHLDGLFCEVLYFRFLRVYLGLCRHCQRQKDSQDRNEQFPHDTVTLKLLSGAMQKFHPIFIFPSANLQNNAYFCKITITRSSTSG